MATIELILELPAHDSAASDFPDEAALPRTGAVGRASGLDGQQVVQLGVLVSAMSLATLRTWLLARAERLKHTRVVWNGREFHGYTAREVELLIRALQRELGDGEQAAEEPADGSAPTPPRRLG
jgi:hypothetical protein